MADTATLPAPQAARKTKKYKFQLMDGTHIENDEANPVIKNGVKLINGGKMYYKGQVIETDEDLSLLDKNVAPGDPKKFRKLDEADGVRRLPGESKLGHKQRLEDLIRQQREVYQQYFDDARVDDMSLEQLREFAARENMDLSKAKPDRDGVLKAVKAEIAKLMAS